MASRAIVPGRRGPARGVGVRRAAGPAVFLLSWTCLAGAACEQSAERVTDSDRGPPRYGGTVVVAGTSDLESANALVAGDVMTQEVNRYLLFLPLLAYDATLDYVPRLAESWRMLGDTAVVFRLRRDVRWHDGHTTTARDVAFTFRRLKDPETAFPNAAYFEHWTGVTVLDSFTVRFRFAPHADPLAGVAMVPIMPRHLLDSIAPSRMRQAAFNKQPVGNGPFRFVSQRTNEGWILEANEDFPGELGGRPYVDRFVWRVVPERQAQVVALVSGDADVILAPPADRFQELASEPGLRGIVRPSRKYTFIGWNGRRAPFGDARVRRALAMAVDRGEMLAALRDGRGELAVGPVDPHHWAYDTTLVPLPFDRAAAGALLAEAGFVDRDGDGATEGPDGTALAFDLAVPAGSDFSRNIAELVQSDLADVGVQVRIRTLDWNTLVADISGPERRFDAVVMGWEGDLRPNLRDLFHSAALDGPFQLASYADPEVDALLDSLAVITERDAAAPLWSRLQAILRRDQPWTFLYYYPDLALARDRVRGIRMDIRGALAGVAHWWLVDADGP